MKEKERDNIDDLLRTKLLDFEADVQPDDWEAIARRLPAASPVPLRRRISYWAAAAVVSFLVATTTFYLFDHRLVGDRPDEELKTASETLERRLAAGAGAATHPEKGTYPTDGKSDDETSGIHPLLGNNEAETGRNVQPHTKQAQSPLVASVLSAPAARRSRSASSVESRATDRLDTSDTMNRAVIANDEATRAQALSETPVPDVPAAANEPTAAAETTTHASALEEALPTSSRTPSVSSPRRTKKKSPARKWGIGMGAGSLSVGADNLVPQYVTNSSTLRSESLMLMNAVNFNNLDLPKTEIHHKTPVSFGISVSRYLTNRFSLQTGLNYAFLSSEWETNGSYRAKTKQKLHFIGIPLSVSYKIAEWNRFNVYAAAGGMTEINVTGKRKTQFFYHEKEMDHSREHIRMKEWLWSVNARAGVSYPLIRFVSAFAEVGASYYFDNGSDIETIHSEKPFNVSLQLGFRLGF